MKLWYTHDQFNGPVVGQAKSILSASIEPFGDMPALLVTAGTVPVPLPFLTQAALSNCSLYKTILVLAGSTNKEAVPVE